MRRPELTVVIVNYNGGALLGRAVAAVLASTVDLELLLVDNASCDGSLSGLGGIPGAENIRIIENPRNLGFAAANNIALRQVRSRYVLLLNPDCLVQQDTLARMLETMESYPQAGMAGCRILNPDGSEQAGCRRSLPDAGSGIARALGIRRSQGNIDLHQDPLPVEPVFVEAISGAFMLVRYEALREVGMLDEGYFLHCEDLDWCRQFADAGWKILFVPFVEVTHHQGSCSQQTPLQVSWHKHRGMARYYRKFLAAPRPVVFNALVYLGIYLRFATLAARVGLLRAFRR